MCDKHPGAIPAQGKGCLRCWWEPHVKLLRGGDTPIDTIEMRQRKAKANEVFGSALRGNRQQRSLKEVLREHEAV